MSRTLFAISDDLLALEDILTEIGGEVTDEEAEAAIDEWLSSLGAERDSKLDSYAALIKEFEARADARKGEAERLLMMARRDATNAGRLHQRLQMVFERQGWSKLETHRYAFAMAKHGGKVPLVVDLLPDELPERFRRVKTIISADNEAIRAALESGEELKFARLGERGQSLRIR